MSWIVHGTNGKSVIPLEILPLPPQYKQQYEQQYIKSTNKPKYQLPPPLPSLPPPYITSHPDVQAVCLQIITQLGYTILNNQPHSNCRFFLRGTNIVPFIKHGFDSRIKFPYSLTSDFDCEVLINPYQLSSSFEKTHKEILDTVFSYCIDIVNESYYWDIIHKAAKEFGIYIEPLIENYPIKTTNNEYTSLNKFAKGFGKYSTIRKYSPFYVYKVNELYVMGKPTHISQVKLGIRIPNKDTFSKAKYPFKTIDLIDISIPKQTNEHIEQLWKLSDGLQKYSENIYLSSGIKTYVEFNRLDLPSSILNLEYAANSSRETRKNKQNKRRATAKNLRNFYDVSVKGFWPIYKGNNRNRTIRRAKNLGINNT